MKSIVFKELLVVIFDTYDLNSRNLYKSLEEIYNNIDDHKLFILDLSNIKHLNGEALCSLVYLQKTINKKRKALKMYQTKEQIFDVYHKLNLDSVIYMMDHSISTDSENMVYYL